MAASASSRRAPSEAISAAAAEREIRKSVVRDIINGLNYETIKPRYEAVDDAHRETFHWIYQNPCTTRDRVWSDFDKWLRQDDGVYWISGKPAAGKSCLMKYLIENPETSRRLQAWNERSGSDSVLCTAKLFFWLSATPDQRSQAGLLRSILHELFIQFPRFVPIAFPED
jgi:hypothetical protein